MKQLEVVHLKTDVEAIRCVAPILTNNGLVADECFIVVGIHVRQAFRSVNSTIKFNSDLITNKWKA